MFILRANRVGNYSDKSISWKFYGHSKLVNPYGEIELSLGHKEEILLCDVEKDQVLDAKKLWGWKKDLLKRDMI